MDGNTYPLLHDTKMIIVECEVVKALLHHSASNPEKMGRILLQNLVHGALVEVQFAQLALPGPRATLRAVGLARLEPLEDALRVEHVTARDGRELVRGREELQAGGAADPHDGNLDLMV